jgi:hypothetical protein
MAFHELGTNAAKHGALSVPGGMVRLSWGNPEEDAAGARWHEVLWEEAGGPSIAGPPSRRGFGTRLLERGLAAQIGGTVTLDFAPSGLRCHIRVPASDSRGVAGCTRPLSLTGTGTMPAGAQTAGLPAKTDAASSVRLAIDQPDRLPDPEYGRGG